MATDPPPQTRKPKLFDAGMAKMALLSLSSVRPVYPMLGITVQDPDAFFHTLRDCLLDAAKECTDELGMGMAGTLADLLNERMQREDLLFLRLYLNLSDDRRISKEITAWKGLLGWLARNKIDLRAHPLLSELCERHEEDGIQWRKTFRPSCRWIRTKRDRAIMCIPPADSWDRTYPSVLRNNLGSIYSFCCIWECVFGGKPYSDQTSTGEEVRKLVPERLFDGGSMYLPGRWVPHARVIWAKNFTKNRKPDAGPQLSG